MYYATMDLETTGIDTILDEPVQVAWMITDQLGMESRAKSYYIKTEVPISQEAYAKHGIDAFKIEKEGITCKQAAKNYTSLVWDHQPLILVGYNFLGFDFPMWMNFLARYNQGMFKFPPVMGVVDVMHLGSMHLKTRKWPKLKDLATTLGIEFKEKELHDALADIRLTWKCFAKIKEIGG